jgi:hypothetical protein
MDGALELSENRIDTYYTVMVMFWSFYKSSL